MTFLGYLPFNLNSLTSINSRLLRISEMLISFDFLYILVQRIFSTGESVFKKDIIEVLTTEFWKIG
jgi:hypothetical protein